MEIQIISLIIALLAVLVGPFVAIKIAKAQIHSQLVSANRHVWINEFRESISEFHSHLMHLIFLMINNNLNNNFDLLSQSVELQKDFTNYIDKLNYYDFQIKLLLNHNVTNHNILYNLLQQLLNHINNPQIFSNVLSFNKTMNEKVGEIIIMSKQIIQDEMKLITKNK